MRLAVAACGASAFGAMLAVSAAALFPGAPQTPPARFFFPPDLFSLSLGVDPVARAALAGGAAGLAIAIAVGRAGAAGGLLAFLNPLVLAAFLTGTGGLFYFAATLLLLTATMRLVLRRDHAHAAGLGLAAGAAPFVFSGALVFYPALLALAPFLSPWGAAPRRLAGFCVALMAPFALACLGALYIAWLFDEPLPAAASEPGDVFSRRGLHALAAAGILAVAGSVERPRSALVLALLAGGGAVFFWRG